MNIVAIIGLVAAMCTTVSFLPQIIKSVKTKHTADLSLTMYSILTIGVFSWLIYGILIQSLPIIIANTITLFFSFTILVLKLKYK